MKKIVILMILMLGSMIVPSLSVAQTNNDQITISKSDLPPELQAKLQAKIDSTNLSNKIEQYGKWVGVGHEVGTAVNESLQAISKNSQELADSHLGHFVMWMVGYSVMGRDLLKKLIGVLLMGAWIIIFVWYYKKNCNPLIIKTVTIEGGKKTISQKVEDPRDHSENQGERIVSALIFVIVSIIIMGVLVV